MDRDLCAVQRSLDLCYKFRQQTGRAKLETGYAQSFDWGNLGFCNDKRSYDVIIIIVVDPEINYRCIRAF